MIDLPDHPESRELHFTTYLSRLLGYGLVEMWPIIADQYTVDEQLVLANDIESGEIEAQLGADGKLHEITIVKNSSSPILDQEAVRAITEGCKSFVPLPTEFSRGGTYFSFNYNNRGIQFDIAWRELLAIESFGGQLASRLNNLKESHECKQLKQPMALLFRLEESGDVSKVVIFKSSGSPQLDLDLIQLLKNSLTPISLLPAHIQGPIVLVIQLSSSILRIDPNAGVAFPEEANLREFSESAYFKIVKKNIDNLTRRIRENPFDIEALFEQASLYKDIGLLAERLPILRKALELEPANMRALNGLHACLEHLVGLQLISIETASAELEQTLLAMVDPSINANNAMRTLCVYRLCEFYCRTNRYSKAKEFCHNIGLNDSESHRRMAYGLEQAGDLEDSAKEYALAREFSKGTDAE